MKIPPKSWEIFWDRDAHHIQRCLNPELLGVAPLTILCYQPVKERLVYLKTDAHIPDAALESGESSDPILGFSPTQSSLDFLRDQKSSSPWLSDIKTIEEAPLIDYPAINDPDQRRSILNAERDRYGKQYPYETRTSALKLDGEYRRQLVVPSPTYHDSGWWNQVARFGIAYTIKDMLANRANVEKDEFSRVADSMLFVMAAFAANRILARRLRLVFNNSYPERKPSKSTGFKKSKRSPFFEDNVARQLWLGEMGVCDESIFFVCKLILAHHLFFPHRPQALEIFESFSIHGSASVLEMHGWEIPQWKIVSCIDLKSAIDCLIVDIKFFISALIRWEDPTDPKTLGAQEKLNETLETVVYLSLGQLAGKICDKDRYVKIVPPDKLTQIRTIKVPAFGEGQIRQKLKMNKAKSDKAFSKVVYTVAPIHRLGEDLIWNNNGISEISYPENEVTNMARAEIWLSQYICARYFLGLPRQSPTNQITIVYPKTP
ncbi:MAG TPA: hypothetical protein VGG56_11595 [Terracidiphilus sp.]|jgi:hypothetical protein